MRVLFLALATGFGSGYSPKAPGTVGSLLGVIIIYFLKSRGLDSWVILAASIPIGTAVAHVAENYLGEHDSPKIVIDEITGMLIAGLFLPIAFLLPAFLLFRLLDIVKPGPIGSLQRLPGGLGIMADDVLAGFLVWANLKTISMLF
jgi:phosphatidylglycerophosphatase A